MTNREIARKFNMLAKLKELHGENPFRTRAYSSAYIAIRKLAPVVMEMSYNDLIQIHGIGKTIADKIIELQQTGEISALNAYLDKTPEGIVEMLQIKGFGPKKVRTVWKDMGIETPGELLYACNENRLVEFKGFGQKTQESLQKQVAYFLDSQGKYLFGHIESEGLELKDILEKQLPGSTDLQFTGAFRRKMPVLNAIEMVSTAGISQLETALQAIDGSENRNGEWFYRDIRIIFHSSDPEVIGQWQFDHSASEKFLIFFREKYGLKSYGREMDYFEKNGLSFIPPEFRESDKAIAMAREGRLDELIGEKHIGGVIHAHSTYSDGSNTLLEMALAAIERGYQYLVISDHSKAAFYANGLSEERVLEQMQEIDQLNAEWDDFRIFKSIECDILNDGSLDYGDSFLDHFELVIASVHSNLKMSSEKANERILTAIANPHTRILGHPTGRLLLSRPGYPLDHRQIIDACAEHGVAIEINANPYRLDLDWTWIGYAIEKEVLLSINPDAHSVVGIDDIRYGVAAARKGGLTRKYCLNAKSREEFIAWMNNP